MKRSLLTLLIFGALPLGVVWAQESEEDLGHGVARLSVINGDVSVRRGDTGDWVAAAVNAPIVVEDSVFVGATSRAEIQLDYANMVRLASNTEMRFSELEYRRYQLQLARGTVTFSVLRDSDADVDLSTPNVSVRPLKKGRYRVAVRDNGDTEITVRSGEVEVFTPLGVETLRPGKTMLVRGTASDPQFQVLAAIARDEWDRWNEERDKQLKGSDAYRYVSRDVYGAEDLDGHGRWVYAPQYGWVWSPYATPDWAPYRHGRWSWVDWYGWSWISHDPWGWAPYHYGRWFHNGSHGWCWWPGGMHVRHHWRPALVAFFGWGGHSGLHVGLGFGFGHVGWLPLAPHERYHRWYGRNYYGGYRNRTHIDNSVNIVNNVNITNIYRNARVNNAVTAVNGADFGRGRVNNVYRASSNDLRRTNLVRGQLPVAPRQESLRVSDRQVRTANLPAARSGQTFATRRTARSTGRVSFADQQRGMEQVAKRTYQQQANPRTAQTSGRSATQGAGAPRSASSSVVNAERPATSRTATQGWRRFGESLRTRSGGTAASSTGATRSATSQTRPSTASSSTGRSATRSGGASTSGWRGFGESTRTARPSARTGGSQPAQRSTSGRSGASGSSTGWRSLGTPPTQTGSANRSTSSRSTSPSRSSRSSQPSSSPSRGYEGSTTRSVPISPPIVRQRSSPRTSGSSRSNRPSGSVFGGSSRSAPPSSRSTSRSGSSSRSSGSYSRPSVGSSGGRTSAPSGRSGGSVGRSSGGSSGGRSSAPSGRSSGGGSSRSSSRSGRSR